MRRQELDGVVELTPKRFGDERGYFCETFNRARYAELGIVGDFVQDNESLSAPVGTLRGLHYQLAPAAQGKLVRVTSGSVLDVAVDIRPGSPTFGDHVAVTLSAHVGNQLWIPEGFAHGFCTLEPDTVFAYKVTDYYEPSAERAIRWDDPDIGIEWPFAGQDLTISPKDAGAPTLHDQPS